MSITAGTRPPDDDADRDRHPANTADLGPRSPWRSFAAALLVAVGVISGCGNTGMSTRADQTVEPDTAAEWAAQTFGTFDEVSASGEGAGRVDLPAEVSDATFGIVRVTYEGAEPLLISTLTADGEPHMALVDSTLGYATDDPTRFDGESAWWPANEPPAGLVIEGDGTWSITVLPADAAPPLPDTGQGPRVYLYDGPGGDFIAHGSSPDSEISVTEYPAPAGSLRQATEPNRSGDPSSGTLTAGPSIVIVTHSDAWTLDLP